MEDYLEAVLALRAERDVVRVTDLADELGVAKPTVSAALKKLVEAGYVEHATYGHVKLTDRGRDYARNVLRRHRLLRRFFADILGVDPETAADDACRAEHHVSRLTLERLTRFIEFIDRCPRTQNEWLEHFHCFCTGGRAEGADGEACALDCVAGCREALAAPPGPPCLETGCK